ncbi:MAG: DUF2007 domain-containing protein [Mitsuaria chitosanitabida]|uniref:hypothetical protein n=1 Tax=Roseateles chitosanitabidus TaxID=65048 RepID=UPI001B17CC52|nr:hypothetical protein [Roseateles chitosanitabidus]MBO9685955.1 DUF2007 domain-containing protein [Roseateles chitosanitabidus]
MTDHDSTYAGDFVRVATCYTATEAHVLRNVLVSAGLDPEVADANMAQMQPWMTVAFGGVRVLVPQSQVASARRAIEDYEAGRLVLPGGDPAPEPFATLPAPVFSIDRAALLSFALTPLFGVAVQIFNASVIGPSAQRLGHWLWLAFFLVATPGSMVLLAAGNPGPFIVLRAALSLSIFTGAWYVFSAQKQSRQLLTVYGPAYRKRSLLTPAIVAALVAMALGQVWSTLD